MRIAPQGGLLVHREQQQWVDRFVLFCLLGLGRVYVGEFVTCASGKVAVGIMSIEISVESWLLKNH